MLQRSRPSQENVTDTGDGEVRCRLGAPSEKDTPLMSKSTPVMHLVIQALTNIWRISCLELTW